MIPWYAMPSIITRSPARRAHPRTKARWRHPVSPRERVLRALIGGTFRFGNLESFWGTHPGSPGGGPGLYRGSSCSRERSWLREACRSRTNTRRITMLWESHCFLRESAVLEISRAAAIWGVYTETYLVKFGQELARKWALAIFWIATWRCKLTTWHRRCTSEKPCLEWNAKFFWWISTSVMLLLLGVIIARLFFALETLVFTERCGEIRDVNCMSKIIWK